MKAMLLDHHADVGTAPLQLRDLPTPEPGPGQVRVKVHVCGICRTDLHVVEGELPPSTRPIIPGHQAVGVVDHLGPDVTTLKLGDRVGIAWLQDTCETCEFCTTGRENLCQAATFSGYHVHGGFAEYALVFARFAYPIPSMFSDAEAAPLLCAGHDRVSSLTAESAQARGATRLVRVWRVRPCHHSNRTALGMPGLCVFTPNGASIPRQTVRRHVGGAGNGIAARETSCVNYFCASRASCPFGASGPGTGRDRRDGGNLFV